MELRDGCRQTAAENQGALKEKDGVRQELLKEQKTPRVTPDFAPEPFSSFPQRLFIILG